MYAELLFNKFLEHVVNQISSLLWHPSAPGNKMLVCMKKKESRERGGIMIVTIELTIYYVSHMMLFKV